MAELSFPEKKIESLSSFCQGDLCFSFVLDVSAADEFEVE